MDEPESMPENTMYTKITENWRVYHFPDGEAIEIIKPRQLYISESQTHRIKTEDGKFHIIPYKWLHIELDSEVGKWER